MKFYFWIYLFTFINEKNESFSGKSLLENTYNYRNELCSYNGIPTYDTKTNEVTCECKEKYVNEPRKDKYKYINGHFIQCSYEKKSRFTAIFLSLCLPFGFDFLYIGRIKFFIIFFVLSILMVTTHCIMFIINYKINLGLKETEIQNRLNLISNKNKNPIIIKNNKCIKIINIISKIILIIYLIFVIMDLFLHITGKITDVNLVETENDFFYIFSFPND